MEASRFIRTSLITCLAATAAPCAFAVPAAPGLHTLQQPDGSTFEARQWGDERVHGWETGEGYSIVYDGAQRAWTYAMRGSAGQLVSSGAPVNSAPSPGPMHVRPSPAAIAATPSRQNQRQVQFQRAAAAGGPQRAIATTGTGYLLTLLVNFSNTSSSYTNANFNTLIYGAAGTKSVNDDYLEMSHGIYSISGAVKGWYTASNTHDYYGANVSGNDAHPGTLVREAVAALETAEPAFDWSPYDQDGDCYVDSVSVVHQGTGEEEGLSATDIWSHSWDLNSAAYYGYSSGGEYTTHTDCPGHAGTKIKVNAYVIQPEKSGTGMITIGVFAHEYGHALGLPDLYDTDYSSEGVGDWSLMSGGSWNQVTNPGDSPAHMDAWSKWALGWLTPTNVTGNLKNESIEAASVAADVYRLGTGTATSGEYFLVENRQKSGFDAGLPGAGVLIWHVDAAKANNNSECGVGVTAGACSATRHYKVALVQSDNSYHLEKSGASSNRGDANDPYAQGKSFAVSTSPNSRWYNGTASGVLVSDIGALGATMTATLSYGNVAPATTADSYSTNKNTDLTVAAANGVLHNDSDANGDTLTVSSVTTPIHGTVSVQPDGSFTYTPATDYVGSDSFTYMATDGIALSTATTVSVTVTSTSNTPPVAVADAYTTTSGATLSVAASSGVLHNDTDADGNTLTAAVVDLPLHGTLTLNGTGGFTYTSAAGFTGADSFTYKANDGSADSAPATVTLTVNAKGGGGGGGGAFGPLALLSGLALLRRRRHSA